MDVGTTDARGGSDLGCDSEVGGRLELDPGRPSRAESGRLKLNVVGKGRKDCDCAELDVEGARKDWPGSRKEWLGLDVFRFISEDWTCQFVAVW
jgi:hypothetical protein